MSLRAALACVAVLIFATGQLVGAAQDTPDTKKAKDDGSSQKVELTDEQIIAAQLPFYPLTTCVVSGEDLDEDAVSFVAGGNLYRTCCKRCAAKVKEDPSKFRGKVERAVVAAQKPLWPLANCPISDDPYGGEMGEPVDVVVGMRYVKLCCNGCKRSLAKAPERIFAKVDKALIAEQKKTYPLTTCVISGEELGSMGEPIDKLYGTTLVRLCCKGCVKKYDATAAACAKKVKDARIDKRRGKDAGAKQ